MPRDIAHSKYPLIEVWQVFTAESRPSAHGRGCRPRRVAPRPAAEAVARGLDEARKDLPDLYDRISNFRIFLAERVSWSLEKNIGVPGKCSRSVRSTRSCWSSVILPGPSDIRACRSAASLIVVCFKACKVCREACQLSMVVLAELNAAVRGLPGHEGPRAKSPRTPRNITLLVLPHFRFVEVNPYPFLIGG